MPPESHVWFDRERDSIEFGRVNNLSDGVFAIALTLLALSLEIPSGVEPGELGSALLDISPMMLAFGISVALIAIFWFSHHELLSMMQGVDHRFMAWNVTFLSLVVLIPFVQRVQGEYPLEPLSYVIFAAVLAMLNVLDGVMRRHVYRARLLRTQWTEGRYRLERLRATALSCGFLISIPLAFVLVNWTILIWVLMLPLDRYLSRRGRMVELLLYRLRG